MDGPPNWFFLFPLVWIGLVIGASIIYRLSKGKPIWYRDPPNNLFLEKRASGNSRRAWYTQLGGARNALAVAVTPEHLIIRPLFPFNLMFLPEVYGLEAVIPIGRIRSVEVGRHFGQKVINVDFEQSSGEIEGYSLALRQQDRFLDSLDRARGTSEWDTVR